MQEQILNLTRKFGLLAAICCVVLSGCKERGCTDPKAANYKLSAELDDGTCRYESITDELKDEFRINYADMAFAVYDDAYRAALDLQILINAFIEAPTAAGLQACRDQWVLAHIPYSQSEVFSRAMGPVDPLEQRINAWEMEPAFLDYLSDSANSGIVYDLNLAPAINQETLLAIHQSSNPKHIALGYHAIEFLLWGEDDDVVIDQLTGDRSYLDYVPSDSSAQAVIRRGALLKAITNQLVIDLREVADEWNSSFNNNYRREFLRTNSPGRSTRLAMTGLVAFMQYELGQNRIYKTLNGIDPNREESAFSDNTHRDIYFNVIGMKSLLTGRYGRTDSTYVEGTSLMSIFEEADPESAAKIKEVMDKLIESAIALESPYDYRVSLEQETLEGPITTFYSHLETFGNRVTEISIEMGMGIRADLPQ